jgi:tRNA threonylcarbamoyl adenosine modification protein YeaZ
VILVIDTSSSQLSIGVASQDGALLREFHAEPSADAGQRAIHDARLAIETSKLLRDCNVSPNEIARIGIIIGPGSFTGLRIGLSFAKGLAFAVETGIVPMTLHEVLAAEAGNFDGLIVTPAYREELCYVSDANTPKDIHIRTSAEFLDGLACPILARESFLSRASSYIPPSSSFVSLSLASMARLTANSSDVVSGVALDSLEPLYLTEFNVVHTQPKGQY